MRILPITAGWLLAAAFPLLAQVQVEVVLDQEQFLRDESLPVKVRITNRSGQTLKLGADADWLTFSVESRDGFIVTKLADAPAAGEFSLESAMVGTKRIDLLPYFDVSQPGRYTVVANVKIKQWNDEVSSKPKPFEISRGTKIWEQEFGVPTSAGAPEVRKYALQQAQYLKRLVLYCRLTDAEDNRVFRVLPLGPLVSFSRPEAQVDKASNLHVLFQTGARSFVYNMINPDGAVLVRQTHDYTASRPRLKGSEDGTISVSGGARRASADDLPASTAVASTNNVNAPKP